MTADRSGTPLAQKLGIRENSVLVVPNDSGHLDEVVAQLPPDPSKRTGARGAANIALSFTSAHHRQERRIAVVGRLIHPGARCGWRGRNPPRRYPQT